jgi:hypothetical protein
MHLYPQELDYNNKVTIKITLNQGNLIKIG